MDPLSGLGLGFGQVAQPFNFSMILIGVVLGLVIGVLPGLGGTSGVAILLPVTVFIAPNAAIMLLAGIYWGALFGGVVTSILFNIPGEPWSVAVMFDGHPLARMGKAGLALTAAFLASFFSAMVANVLFTFFALPLAEFALRFGPPELFAIMLLAFGTFVGLGGGSPIKTVIMLCAGFLLAAVGLDIVTGQPRLTFGIIDLQRGIDFVPVAIGVFGIAEILGAGAEAKSMPESIAYKMGLADLKEALLAHWRHLRMFLVNTLIGFWVGVMPGTGATPASFMGYGIAQRYSKHPERFGKGELIGVISPQAAANAAGVGSILPMVTLGVPGSPTAAVIMAGLFIWGLNPGPTLFQQKPDFVWGLIASLYVAHTLSFLICLLGVPLLAAIMKTPFALLTPLVVMVSTIGAYVINNSILDVSIMLVSGVIGFFLNKLKFPMAPLVVALVLGAPTERAFRQMMIMGDGSPVFLFERPISAILTAIALLLFLLPALGPLRRRLRPTPRVAEKPSAA
jgi:putative tricarboxylic transport membrane protein